ncbi:MAG TPA: DUF3857 domain-containing protein [Niastella sp.]|nr:DUF3857 domain-containing protein [Niastella sp.]
MRKIIFAAVTLMGFLKSWAGDVQYPVAAIPEALMKDANVVKRTEDITFEIVSTDKTILHYKYALTILNEAGDAYAGFVEWYDKLRKIQTIEGSLYDASGRLLKKVKDRDIQDLSAVDDISLIDDNRKKVHHFYYKVYPYTVVYEAQVQFNNTFNFPSWIPQEYQHQSVEKSSYTLICPDDYSIRYRMFNYKGEPAQATVKGKKTFHWETGILPAIEREYSGPRWHEMTTMVLLAPTVFEIEGYKGTMNSWQEFGKFIYALKQNRDALPDPVKEKVVQLTAGVKSDAEKVKLLYLFLQQNTRYISIQLGLGGWQPFDASYVSQKGYGDCKALSNYMYSLLKAAGIKSYYALIHAGEGEQYITEDFPSNQFNHALLCVPTGKDTLWLECTDQTKPAGYMGLFTGNRKALLIDESGGILVNTPAYTLKENTQTRSVKGKLDGEGNLHLKSVTTYKAAQQDQLYAMINYLSSDKVKEILNKELDFSTYSITNFAYKQNKERVPEVAEELEITVAGFGTISGKRLFITPNILNRSTTKLMLEERKYSIEFNLEYKDVDSVEIEVPAGYELESLPQQVRIKNGFGSYSATTTYANNKIVYVRTREQYAGHFQPTVYADLVKYYEAIYKGDRNRLVLKKGE